MRWMTGAALGLAVIAGPAGLAMAGTDDDGEEYPPGATIDTVDPGGGGGDDGDGDGDGDGAGGAGDGDGRGNIPATGNSDTGTWVTLGAGAVAVGGILVAATARRRRYLT